MYIFRHSIISHIVTMAMTSILLLSSQQLLHNEVDVDPHGLLLLHGFDKRCSITRVKEPLTSHFILILFFHVITSDSSSKILRRTYLFLLFGSYSK